MTNDDGSTDRNPPVPPRVLGREPRVVRKRFYATVGVAQAAGGFSIELDGSRVRTPRKLPLVVSAEALAQAIAAEWDAQATEINPATMPLTTLACTAIDAVADQMAAVADEIGSYAMSDLLLYRAEAPLGLVEQQSAGWDPVLDWAAGELGVGFKRTTGLMPVAQAPAVKAAVAAQLAPLEPLPLAAVHVLTTLTGSALLALAVWRRRLDLETSWALAHIDEDWQIARWGADAEAEARRAARWVTAAAATQVLAAEA